MLVPEFPGNRRFDGVQNLVPRPGIGLLFVVPGISETLRVNGFARLTREPELLEACAVDGRRPWFVADVEVRQVFSHCGKAFLRSRLWQPEAWPDPDTVRSPSRTIAEAAENGRRESDVRRDVEEAYRPGSTESRETGAAHDEHASDRKPGGTAMTAPYTLKKLTDVEDSAVKFGMGEFQEARFATDDLDAEQTGVSLHRARPASASRSRTSTTRPRRSMSCSRARAASSSTPTSSASRSSMRSVSLRASSAPSRPTPTALQLLVFGPRYKGDGEVIQGWWSD